MSGGGNAESGDDLYDKALAVVARDKKASHLLHPAAVADRL